MKSRLSLDALVFDFDGLILDTEWPKFTATEWLEEATGQPVARDAVRARALSHSLGLPADAVVRPGVIDLLDEADRRDIGLAVASSSPRDWVGSHLERLCLLSRFDVVVTRDDVGATKPAPDLYLAAMAALDTSGSRSVAFEDSTHGCTSAVTAGLFCVVAPNRLTDSQDFSGADLVVSSLAEVDVAILVALMHGDPDDSSVRPTEP